MRAFDTMSRILSTASAYCALSVLILMQGHMTLEIILRSFFGRSTLVVEEFVGYALASMIFLALGRTLLEGAFIRFDILFARAGPTTRRFLELFAVAATFLTMSMLGYYLLRTTMRDFSRNATSTSIAEVPLWIPQGIVLIGIMVFLIQLASYFTVLVFKEDIIQQSNSDI